MLVDVASLSIISILKNKEDNVFGNNIIAETLGVDIPSEFIQSASQVIE